MLGMNGVSQIDWRVYLVVDPDKCRPQRGYLETARAAIEGGAGVVQLRDKDSTDQQLVRRARRLADLCHTAGAVCIINDRIDVALVGGADGVHLGPDDLPVDEAVDLRERVGLSPEAFVIGASAGTPDRARRLVEAGADYLGVGAMYDAAPSKPDASTPRGPQAIEAIRQAVDVPIVGIGGITPANAADVRAAGADGVAVIRAICAADDARQAARDLRVKSG
jgi:thiamine-phosphate pyrophosphorylase